jgi:hypothetical protein
MKRRGGGASSTQTQRQKQQRVDRKKPCDLGKSCPYQDEFQHLMEFSHECEPVRTGRGSSGVTSSSSSSGGRARNAFSGAGVRLGGDGAGFDIGRYRELEESMRTGAPASNYYEADDDDVLRCEICSKVVTLSTLEAHMLSHERPDRTLKSEQDEALEQSVLDDIQRQSAEEAERVAKAKKEAEEKERLEVEAALKASKAAAAKGNSYFKFRRRRN